MNNIEDDLRKALRRQEPPPDLVGKIVSSVASGEGLEPEARHGSNKVLVFRPKPRVFVWLVTAAAAACLAGLFVTRSYLAERGKMTGSGPAQVAKTNLPPTDASPVPNSPQTASGADHGGVNQQPNLVGGPGAKPNYIRSYHRRSAGHVSEEARRAEEQLRLALTITSAKLGYAQRSIREVDGTGSSDRPLNR